MLDISQPVQHSLALRALVGDFRGGECQIGLSRLGDSGLPSQLHPSLPPCSCCALLMKLGNHIMSWAASITGPGLPTTGEPVQTQRQAKVTFKCRRCGVTLLDVHKTQTFPSHRITQEFSLYRLAPWLLVTGAHESFPASRFLWQ